MLRIIMIKKVSCRSLTVLLFAFFAGMDVDRANAQSAGPNILFLTVDDMSCDSIGTFGCAVPDTTPNIDRLATEGLRFTRAHVQVGNCMPSRNVMQSGLYPHNNGVEGFYQITERSYKILPELLKDAGWFVGIKGKVPHTTPAEFEWDVVLQPDTPGNLRNREWFYKQTVEGIEMARAQNKPFYLEGTPGVVFKYITYCIYQLSSSIWSSLS